MSDGAESGATRSDRTVSDRVSVGHAGADKALADSPGGAGSCRSPVPDGPLAATSQIAAFADANVPTADPTEMAGAVRARLLTVRFASVDPVFVLGTGRTLIGVVPLAALLTAPDATPITALVVPDWPRLPAGATAEDAASLAIRHNAPALSILDHHGAFLGAITPTSIMALLRSEHLEDLHHMAGILGRSQEAKAALTAPPYQRALFRLPWLLVGVAGSMVATMLMAGAEATLSSNIAVAFFIPAIVYLADAIGTQSEAVAVRGLSLTDGTSLSLLFGELGTGALLGLVLAALAFGSVWVVFGDAILATAVALSLAVAGTVATGVGFALPWLFQRMGVDPAHGAGPVATVIQDVLSLAVYLGLVQALRP
jgi:magnesium transporter